MDQDKLNKIRRMAGLPDSYNAEERRHLQEKATTKQERLDEAANHRAPANKMAEIARQHLHVRTLDKSGDDAKDYHDLPVWAIENALKAAYKAGVDSVRTKQPVKEAADASSEQSKAAGHRPVYDPKGGERTYKDGEDKVEKDYNDEEQKKRKGLAKGKAGTGYKTPKNKSAKKVFEMEAGEKKDRTFESGACGGEYEEVSDDEAMECPRCKEIALVKSRTSGDVDEYECQECGHIEVDPHARVAEGKKADKDYDKDGKIESEEEEHKGVVDKAIKKSKKEKVREGVGRFTNNDDDRGDWEHDVRRDKELDRRHDRLSHLMSQEKKLKLQLFGARNAQEEADIESLLDQVRSEIAKIKGGYTAEGKSDNYNPPKGTSMKADSSSGATRKADNTYDKKPHKSDSHDAKSEDKGSQLSADSSSGAKKDLPDAYKSVDSSKNTTINYGYEEVKKNARAGLKQVSEETEWYDVDYNGKYQGGIVIKANDEADARKKAAKRIPEGCEVSGVKKSPMKKKVNESDESVFGKDYNYDGRVDKDESPDMFKNDPMHEMKVNVPSQYKSRLQNTITELRKEADKVRVRDPYGAEFYDHTAIAFENLLEHLKTATKHSMLMAQVDLNRIMSPMIQRLPNEVYMFIVRGGKPAALNELFKEVKIKKDGADLSKEKLTK